MVSLLAGITSLAKQWAAELFHSGRRTCRPAMVKRGQEIELRGEVTRIDENSVTIALGPLVTISIDKVRLIEKYRPPTRKKPMRDMAD